MLAKYLLSCTYSKLGWFLRSFLILWLQSGKSNQPARSVYRNKGSITKLDVNRNAIKSLIDRIERFRVKPGREIVCVGLCGSAWHVDYNLVLTTAVTSVKHFVSVHNGFHGINTTSALRQSSLLCFIVSFANHTQLARSCLLFLDSVWIQCWGLWAFLSFSWIIVKYLICWLNNLVVCWKYWRQRQQTLYHFKNAITSLGRHGQQISQYIIYL